MKARFRTTNILLIDTAIRWCVMTIPMSFRIFKTTFWHVSRDTGSPERHPTSRGRTAMSRLAHSAAVGVPAKQALRRQTWRAGSVEMCLARDRFLGPGMGGSPPFSCIRVLFWHLGGWVDGWVGGLLAVCSSLKVDDAERSSYLVKNRLVCATPATLCHVDATTLALEICYIIV